jgi:hypothetical protein
MTADQILAATHYSQVFRSHDHVKRDFLNLSKVYHPDLHQGNSLANEVMTKLNMLYTQAKNAHDGIEFKGKTYTPLYKTKAMDVCDEVIILQPASLDRYLANIKLSYRDSQMQAEFSRYFPQVLDHDAGKVLLKGKDLYSLREIRDRGPMDPVHLAWLMNRLFNIGMYLDYAQLVHGGLTLDNCLFNPDSHTAYLLGGWEHLHQAGTRLVSMDRAVHSELPYGLQNGTEARLETNLYAILAIGRQLLADPKHPMHKALTAEYSLILEAYQSWNQLLKDQFGQRRFVVYDFWR